MRFVGGELATHAFARHMKRSGWDVTVHAQKAMMGWHWEGLKVIPYQDGEPVFGDVLLTHPDVQVDAPAVAEANGMPLAYYVHNTDQHTVQGAARRPAHVTLFNSHATKDWYEGAVGVTGPVMVPQVSGVDTRGSEPPRDAIGAVNLAVSKGGLHFMHMARERLTYRWLGVKGGHGVQNVPPGDMFGNVTVLDPMLPAYMPDQFYSRIRLLLMLSEKESYGMAGLEAAWSGIPTVATQLPGIKEALGHGAVYVRPGDRRGALEWIDLLTTEPNMRAELQAKAVQRAKAQQHEARQGHQLGQAILEHLIGGV